jgi:YegS/Rv2252/BmrU family lipid kinase
MGKSAVEHRSEGRPQPERAGAGQPSLLLIVNPAARGGRAGKEWPRLAAQIRGAGIDFEEAFTAKPQEATEIARRAVRRNVGVVAAVGGDGTFYEVVNGFFEDGEGIPTRSAIGLIPFGTGGDHQRSFGIPDGLLAARVLVDGTPRAIDAVRVRIGGRVLFYTSIGEAGLGAFVADKVNRTPKTLGGKVSFQIGSLRGIATWKHVPVKVVIDGRLTRELTAQAVTVANCSYYGGGMMIAPMAVPDDGLLDVLITGAIGKLESISGLGKIYTGAHIDDPKLRRWFEHFTARKVEVDSPVPVLVQLDGEIVGNLPATFEVMPGAVRLMTPAI